MVTDTFSWSALYQRRDSRVIVERRVKIGDGALRRRLVLAADIHARDDWFPRRCIADVVRAVNAVPDVDAVLLPGDFVSSDASAIDWAAEELGRLDAPAFATLGNHDHWTDPERVSTQLERSGVSMLTNGSLPLGADLWVAGIDSCWGGEPDPERALHDVPDDTPAVVLGHEPFLATMHDQLLHVAGHTHHGQVRLPGLLRVADTGYFLRYSRPYWRGLYERGAASWVYTTAGVGYSGVSWRFNCPPEIVVIDL